MEHFSLLLLLSILEGPLRLVECSVVCMLYCVSFSVFTPYLHLVCSARFCESLGVELCVFIINLSILGYCSSPVSRTTCALHSPCLLYSCSVVLRPYPHAASRVTNNDCVHIPIIVRLDPLSSSRLWSCSLSLPYACFYFLYTIHHPFKPFHIPVLTIIIISDPQVFGSLHVVNQSLSVHYHFPHVAPTPCPLSFLASFHCYSCSRLSFASICSVCRCLVGVESCVEAILLRSWTRNRRVEVYRTPI